MVIDRMSQVAKPGLGRPDPGLLLTLALCCFAILPLAMKAGLPAGQETALHAYRAAEMLRSWEQGWLFPGWAAGFDSLDALRWLSLLCLLGCGGGMYLFCARRSGKLGAVLAGLIYVTSPYVMYSAPYVLGAYPHLLALALFPILLWRIDALRDKPGPLSFLLVCLLQAALINTDGRMALVLTGMAFAWLLFEILVQAFNREASQMQARQDLAALLAMLLGILAAATVWLPLMLESDPARLPESTEGLRALRLETLLGPAPLADAGELYGLRCPRVLGIAQWTAALLGAVSALALYVNGYRSRHPQTFLGALCFAAMALGLIGLMLPATDALFGDRLLLGPAALCLAVLASLNGIWLSRLPARPRMAAIALLIALPVTASIPLLYVPEWDLETLNTSIAAAHAQERDLASTPTNDAAAIISALALACALAGAWLLSRRSAPQRRYATALPLSRSSLTGLVLGAGIAAVGLLVGYREGVAWIKSPPGQALPAQVQLAYSLDERIQLIGYSLEPAEARIGGRLSLDLFWYAPEPLERHYQSVLALSLDGEVHARFVKSPLAGIQPGQWGAQAYVRDSYELDLPDHLPAGAYTLSVALSSCQPPAQEACGSKATVRDGAGAVIGDRVTIATIRLNAD